MSGLYLYDDYRLGEVAPNGNGNTKQRLSVIEITSIIGVTVSAAILLVNVWNLARQHEREQHQKSVPVADRPGR